MKTIISGTNGAKISVLDQGFPADIFPPMRNRHSAIVVTNRYATGQGPGSR